MFITLFGWVTSQVGGNCTCTCGTLRFDGVYVCSSHYYEELVDYSASELDFLVIFPQQMYTPFYHVYKV